MQGKKISDYLKDVYRKDPGIKVGMRYFRLMFSVTENLYEMRKLAGITQKELARRLNTTQSTIASWETPGYDGYTLKKLFQIADELGFMIYIKFLKKPLTPTITSYATDNWQEDSMEYRINQEIRSREYSENIVINSKFNKNSYASASVTGRSIS